METEFWLKNPSHAGGDDKIWTRTCWHDPPKGSGPKSGTKTLHYYMISYNVISFKVSKKDSAHVNV